MSIKGLIALIVVPCMYFIVGFLNSELFTYIMTH